MSKERRVLLTTLDNPYNPITDWYKWYEFDISHGYNSCGLLARFAITSNGFSDADNDAAIERAIDEIIELHANGTYKKLVIEVDVPDEPAIEETGEGDDNNINDQDNG